MADVDNTADSHYTLSVSDTVDGTYDKVELLQKCDPVDEQKVLDDITPTDAHRTVNAVVNFKENSEIGFEYVLDPADPIHTKIKAAFDAGTALFWQLKFVSAPQLNQQFPGIINNLTPDASDIKKKIRMTGTLTVTGDAISIPA